MAAVVGLRCLRCGSRYDRRHYAQDCDNCHSQAPSNLVVEYDASFTVSRTKPDREAERGLWRYGDLLPVTENEAVTLGEGSSRLHRLGTIGRRLGLEGLFGKDETRNPTWSFKDRLACIAVSVAKKMGDRKYSAKTLLRVPVLSPEYSPKCMATAGPRIKMGSPTPSSLRRMASVSAVGSFGKEN